MHDFSDRRFQCDWSKQPYRCVFGRGGERPAERSGADESDEFQWLSVRFYSRSSEDIVRSCLPGHLDSVCVLARYPLYCYSVGRYHCIFDWYLRFYVVGRVQHQPDHLVCFGIGHRYGSGWCHSCRWSGASSFWCGLSFFVYGKYWCDEGYQ